VTLGKIAIPDTVSRGKLAIAKEIIPKSENGLFMMEFASGLESCDDLTQNRGILKIWSTSFGKSRNDF